MTIYYSYRAYDGMTVFESKNISNNEQNLDESVKIKMINTNLPGTNLIIYENEEKFRQAQNLVFSII